MQPSQRDSIANIFIVATVLCLLCSFLVSASALGLKSIQQRNMTLDKKNNLLQVAGFTAEDIKDGGGIEALFDERFEMLIIDLETGDVAIDEAKAALDDVGKKVGDDVLDKYDQVWASKSKKDEVSDKVEGKDITGIKYREKFSHVYILKEAGGSAVSKYVFPVRGKGLWSMMKGFLAVEPDFQTIAGLTFYEQAETPGLGGEVMNPKWKAKWPGKKIYKGYDVAIEVVKGAGTGDYAVDGLSGATITSNGVSSMLEYWLGEEGFLPYIEQQKSKTSTGETKVESVSQMINHTTKGGSNG